MAETVLTLQTQKYEWLKEKLARENKLKVSEFAQVLLDNLNRSERGLELREFLHGSDFCVFRCVDEQQGYAYADVRRFTKLGFLQEMIEYLELDEILRRECGEVVESIRYPILEQFSSQTVHWMMVSGKRCVDLEKMVKILKKEQGQDKVWRAVLVESLWCLSQLHQKRIAHRNLQASSIVWSYEEGRIKFVNLQYALKYESQVGHHDIVGTEQLILPQLREMREQQLGSQYETFQTQLVNQDLFLNDLFSLTQVFQSELKDVPIVAEICKRLQEIRTQKDLSLFLENIRNQSDSACIGQFLNRVTFQVSQPIQKVNHFRLSPTLMDKLKLSAESSLAESMETVLAAEVLNVFFMERLQQIKAAYEDSLGTLNNQVQLFLYAIYTKYLIEKQDQQQLGIVNRGMNKAFQKNPMSLLAFIYLFNQACLAAQPNEQLLNIYRKFHKHDIWYSRPHHSYAILKRLFLITQDPSYLHQIKLLYFHHYGIDFIFLSQLQLESKPTYPFNTTTILSQLPQQNINKTFILNSLITQEKYSKNLQILTFVIDRFISKIQKFSDYQIELVLFANANQTKNVFNFNSIVIIQTSLIQGLVNTTEEYMIELGETQKQYMNYLQGVLLYFDQSLAAAVELLKQVDRRYSLYENAQMLIRKIEVIQKKQVTKESIPEAEYFVLDRIYVLRKANLIDDAFRECERALSEGTLGSGMETSLLLIELSKILLAKGKYVSALRELKAGYLILVRTLSEEQLGRILGILSELQVSRFERIEYYFAQLFGKQWCQSLNIPTLILDSSNRNLFNSFRVRLASVLKYAKSKVHAPTHSHGFLEYKFVQDLFHQKERKMVAFKTFQVMVLQKQGSIKYLLSNWIQNLDY